MRKHKGILIILISLILIPSFILTASSASSIADEWVMFRHDQNHSGYTTGNGSTNSAKLLWNFTTMGSVASSPAVVNGAVFAASKDSAVYSINSSNGELLWFYPTGDQVRSSPAVTEGAVYVGSYDGNVYALNASNGIKLWNYTTGNMVESSPSVVDNVVYVGSRDGTVYALNASNGAKLWSYIIGYEVFSSPAVSDGVVYVAADDFHVYALNASTGNQIWRRHTGSVFSSPCVQNGYLYIGSYDGYVTALNVSTGDKIWEYLTEGSVSSSPAFAYGRVYAGSDDNNVYCLNATNGKKIWQSPTRYWVRSSPAVADGNIYVGSEDYSVYCFDAFTGEKKWSFETGNFVDSSPAIANSTIYVGSYDNDVYAFVLYNSTVENLPSQSTNAVPWTTIAFDVIAGAVVAAIIYVIALFIHTNRRAKRDAEDMTIHYKKASWFSAHADALCALAILAFSTVFFINLGSGHLWATDEQTYSQWAFHIFKNGDYVTPWAYGEVLMWIAKPPLYMWLMSLAYQVFGVTNFATRLWSPVFGTLSLITIFYLGKKLYNIPVGFISALVLGTFTTFYAFARHAMLDVTFVFFILASIYFLVLSEKREGFNRYASLGGLFFGLAFMTKQVAAFLIPLIVFIYFTATRRGVRFFFTKRFALFWGVGLLVFSPWLIYMILSFGPDFWQPFFVFSGITRASTPIEGHVEGYLFYFSNLANSENLIWVILLPFSAGFCAFNAVIKRSKADTLVIAWMLIVLALFTLIQTKLYWYILPAFPAFAIAISSLIFQLSKKIQGAIRFLSYKALKLIGTAKSWKQQRQHVISCEDGK
jgi:outer membrane protein assembly factor BamB